MKFRSRKYKITNEGQSYWPSFVDIMTTVTLVFFMIMIISTGINSLFVDNISEKRERLYTAIQDKLDQNKIPESVMRFNRKEGKIEIPTETFFETGKWELKKEGIEAAKILEKIFFSLLEDKKIADEIQYIEIIGHTDYLGDTISNRKLSTERAMSFLNRIMPMNSELENEFGYKFKASGMSEFETNLNKELRDRDKYTNIKEAESQRKIEVRMVFSNKDLEEAIKNKGNKKYEMGK